MSLMQTNKLVVCLLIWTTAGYAYEPGTHGNMSDFAAQNSVLKTPLPGMTTTVLQDLNLSTYIDTNQQFPDIQNGESVDLGPNGTGPFKALTPLDVQQLIIAGAQLEDESRLLIGRPLNHFFDPVSGLPLNYTVSNVVHESNFSAPVWAAQSTCAGSSQNGIYNPSGYDFSDTNQCYSLQDGMNYFYNALTAPKAADRNQQFGNLFLTLGHVMHLVQDMAQPQHVRNDPHCDAWQCALVGKYNPSRYEFDTYGPSGAIIQGFAGQYGSVSFPAVRDFWASGDGRGLAEYTNSNFFSAGSLGLYGGAGSTYAKPVLNLSPQYLEPIQNVLADLGRQSNSTIDAECPATAPCYVNFYTSTVRDVYKNLSTTNEKAAAVSLFSADLANKGDTETFSLNDATYEAAWNFLIPAAIDYSTGLLNYFFRGRLSVGYDPANPGNYLITNVSQYAMSNGILQVYYDGTDGKRYPVAYTATDGSQYTVGGTYPTLSLDANCTGGCNDSYSIAIQPPTDPEPLNGGEYLFVFKGTIGSGSEQGVAGYYFKPPADNLNILLDPDLGGNDWLVTVDDSGSVKNTINEQVNDPPFCTTSKACGRELGLAVYGGTTYIAYENGVFKNSDTSAPFISAVVCPSGATLESVNGISANSKGIYILAVCTQNATPASNYVFHYDFSGNLIERIIMPFLPSGVVYGGFNSISVNADHMCILGENSSGVAVVELTDLQGNVVATLKTGQFGGCASTRNRHYVVLNTSGNSTNNDAGAVTTVGVFDDAGTPLTTFTVNNCLCAQLTATENKIYLAHVGSATNKIQTISVVDRLVTAGAESFSQDSDITVSAPFQLRYDGTNLAVDALNVLSGPVQ